MYDQGCYDEPRPFICVKTGLYFFIESLLVGNVTRHTRTQTGLRPRIDTFYHVTYQLNDGE